MAYINLAWFSTIKISQFCVCWVQLVLGARYDCLIFPRFWFDISIHLRILIGSNITINDGWEPWKSPGTGEKVWFQNGQETIMVPLFFGTVFESDPNGVARFRWVDPRSKTMFLGARSHCGMVIACKWAGCLSQFSGTLELGRLRSHNI